MLDNLRDYAVRALVNAVDHLGTVAYKLGDLLEQQTWDISTMDLKVSALNQVCNFQILCNICIINCSFSDLFSIKQQLLTCRIYMDKEGLRQHQLFALIPRHHKHYILPSKHNCYYLEVILLVT